ncbi:hypothetical protein H4218_005775 [Coemansia sp. IMI 209128]|nr:hypothetical protein H4218_005775 [Coemansia sp. IMI 209128]
MPTLSPLQTLPIHTIERIVDFVAINIRLKFGAVNPNTYFEECHILLMPLLGVCHIFRAVVYSRFSMRYRLAVDLEKAHGWPIPCTRCQKRLHNPFHLMAKEVMVSISPLTVFSGKALVALSRAPFNDTSFPLARTLEVYFHNFMDDEEIPAASQDVEDNIGVFVRRIWQMAPNINFVKLSGDLRSWDQDIIHVGALITQLVLSVSRIEFACLRRLVSNAKCPLENVFTPTSHPKLQSVILKPHPNMLLANSPAYSVFLQLVEEIAPDAVVREIDFRAYRLSTPPLLSLFGKFTNLQVLALPELRLSIWDTMAFERY